MINKWIVRPRHLILMEKLNDCLFLLYMILINCLSVLFQLQNTALTLTYYFSNFVIEGLVWKRMHSISIVFDLPSSLMYMLATGLCYSCSTL